MAIDNDKPFGHEHVEPLNVLKVRAQGSCGLTCTNVKSAPAVIDVSLAVRRASLHEFELRVTMLRAGECDDTPSA